MKKETIKKLRLYLKVRYIRLTKYGKFRRARKKADANYRKLGSTWWVLPVGKDLLVVDNKWKKRYNRMAKKSGSKISFVDLDKQSIYKKGK